MKASNCCRFRESVRLSQILSHLTETADTLSTVRAYGVVDRFCRHNCRLTDALLKAQAAYGDCYRFVKMAAAACGFTVVFATLIVNVVPIASGDSLSLSQVGLALSAASSASISFLFTNQGVR